MDNTKAFDLVKFSKLFVKLFNIGLSTIFLRLIIIVYTLQFANVRWNDKYSDMFSISNGVRQGAILSGFLYCFYCIQLFEELRRKRTGCWMNTVYLGILGYSDDNYLLCPSLTGLQEMLKTCEDFAEEHGLRFSTDPNPTKCKTKCIPYLIEERILRPMKLCKNNLPWVKAGKHLGAHIDNKSDGMKKDMKVKRAMYIDKNNELIQEFGFAHPRSICLANQIFNMHWTSSPIWDLFCYESKQIEFTYNCSIKMIFDLPKEAHKFIIEPISDSKHLKFILMKRFLRLSFTNQIKNSKKEIPAKILNWIKYDVRSVTGSNLRHIMLEVKKNNVDSVNINDIDQLKYYPVNEEMEHKKVLIDIKFGEASVPGFDKEEIHEMIRHICIT